jgi:hypothetical protein
MHNTLLLLGAVALTPFASAQTLLFQEGFEGSSAQYTVQNGGGTATGSNNANGTYFARGDGDNLSLDAARNNGQPTGEQGDFVFSGRRTIGTGNANSLKAVVFSPVDVSGSDAVSISFLAGANSAGTYENDGSTNVDFLRLQYRLDGGAYQNCVAFAGISNDGVVRPLARDVDNDGFGDVLADDLDETMTRYECQGVIDVTGTSSLQVRITARTTASSEQVFFDDIRVTDVPNISAAVIDVSDCLEQGVNVPPGADFTRPSPTDRCFPIIEGTNNLDVSQRYTVFFRIDGVGGPASGSQRVTSRGEIKLGSGDSAQNKLSFRTKSSDPDGEYELVLLAALGSQPASAALPGGSAVELDRVPFVKGSTPPLLLRAGAIDLTSFPNPVVDAATLRFGVAEAAEATLVVYDALGREVARPVDGIVDGIVEARFDASALPAGLYVARLVVDGRVETTQLSVIR